MTTRGLLAIAGDWRASTHKEEGAAFVAAPLIAHKAEPMLLAKS
jgi:hypothetical protein